MLDKLLGNRDPYFMDPHAMVYSQLRLGMSTPRQRSHDGCWTCKAKRRKCDRVRPACLACNQRGVACEGYGVRLRWGSGIASRGRYTGAGEPVEAAIPFREKGRRRDRLRERRREGTERLSEDASGVSPLMGDGFGEGGTVSPYPIWLYGNC